jgi:hypothetical protein
LLQEVVVMSPHTGVSTDFVADMMLESLQLWNEIDVGSLVQLEADLIDHNTLVLTRGHLYEVLAKTDLSPFHPMFVVQSELTEELIQLHPGLICNYLQNPHEIYHA